MSRKVTFIWERYHDYLKISPHLRYLFYYRGCFCPPHDGHFEGATKYLNYPNIRMIIHQIGSSRHGVPIDVNRRIWRRYINELLPDAKIDLVQYNEDTRNLPDTHPWLRETDVLVIMRGDEVTNTKIQERKDYIIWTSTIDKCHKYKINVIFAYDIRDHEKMSATTFIGDIIQYKRGKCSIDYLYKYLPQNLSILTKRKIIHLLAKYYLT